MVLLLLADGFEDVEAVFPIDVLRRCGVDLTTVGVGGDYVESSSKITVKPDINVEDVNLGKPVEMLILPGGPGRVNLRKSDKAMALIKRCCDSGVPIAAICGAPELLGEIGFLKGKKATCYPGLEGKLEGAVFSNDKPVVTDGDLITAQGACCAEDFAFAVAEYLCGKEKAAEIRKKMVCLKSVN